jgi:hypothetical protein
MTPGFEWSRTMHTLGRATSVIGPMAVKLFYLLGDIFMYISIWEFIDKFILIYFEFDSFPCRYFECAI